MSDAEYTELIPPVGDKRIGPVVMQLLGAILEHRQSLGLTPKWNLYYKLRRNNQWKNKQVEGVKLVDVNLLHKHHTRTVNMLTVRNPTFELRKTGEIENEEGVRALKGATVSWFRDTDQKRIFREAVDIGETYGTVLKKRRWDQDLNKGLGEVVTEAIEPYYFGIYPPKQREIQKAEANLHFYPLSVREAKRRWPKFAKQIKADQDVLKEIGDDRQEKIAGDGKKSLWTTVSTVVKEVANWGGGSDSSDETVVVECWAKDYTKGLYPGNIRRVTVLSCGEVVVDDRPNPSINPDMDPEIAVETYLWDKFPFSSAQSIINTASFYGDSDFEQLRGIQKEFVKTVNQFNLQKDRAARGKFKNPETSGVRNEELTNTTSILNPVNAEEGAGMGWIPGPTDFADLLEGISFYREFFWEISGTFDLSQANAKGKDVIAYKAIQALIEQASVMEIGKIEEYTRLLTEDGRMYLSLAQNWIKNPRYAVWDENGDETVQVFQGEDLIHPAQVYVVPGSTLPVSRIAQREEAMVMFDKGIIDQQAALEKMEEPNAKEILKRMQAGPMGEALEKMLGVGVPEGLVEYLKEIFDADMKDLQKAIEKGEIPPFKEVLQAALGDSPEEPVNTKEQAEEAKALAEAGKKEAETEKARAETEKVKVETELEAEKILTEQLERVRVQAGIDLDRETLRINKAKAVADMKNAEAEIALKKTTAEMAKKTKEYDERGMKTNNKGEG